ncbi:cytidylyltransferase domain-containing protein [Flagellimonas beolgyonensis]|uniref:acylneuraminate cytidylyltransferase family protein n=1 Tax=Flagellimonas beolgyonensis TaxID=864064 RepID=UPI003D64D148
MISSNNILVVIPARAGSKGIPGKNIKLLGDKPLIAHSIEIAKAIVPMEDICVSTDGIDIKQVAEQFGISVPFIRPSSLASDTAGTYEVLLHALNYFESKGKEYNIVVLLQPTSPFRKLTHVKEALAIYEEEIDMVVSVKETKSNPYYNLFEEKGGFLEKSKKGDFSGRQEIPKVYEYNGAIYIINANALKEKPIGKFTKIKKYVMDELSSMDLDEMLDWRISEFLLKEGIVTL